MLDLFSLKDNNYVKFDAVHPRVDRNIVIRHTVQVNQLSRSLRDFF